MKKLLLTVLFFVPLAIAAQEKERIFNFGPMVRLNAIAPFYSGDNYLGDSDSKISGGFSLSPFEIYRFRAYIGVDHLYFKTSNTAMAADINRTKNTAVYGLISYRAPITKEFSIEPYFGGGWTGLSFKRAENANLIDQYDLEMQDGAQFRLGFFADYKIAPIASVFIGAAYVLDSYEINTVPEYKDYFGEAQSFQLSVGLKLGYTMSDKRKARQAQAEQSGTTK